jgi:zinc protease
VYKRQYHWTPIGFKEDILNWTIKDIKEFHKTYYQPKNAVIVIAGDVEVDEVFKLVKDKFEKIKNRKKIPKVHQKEPSLDGDKKVIIHKKSELEMVAIAYQIPNFEHEDITKLSALSELLSSGNSSILKKELIYKKELVNQISVYPMDNKDNGLFIVLAVCNPSIKAEKVEKEIKKILKNFKITKKELNKLKLNTKIEFITSLESSDSIAQLFGSYFAKGNIKPLLEYEEKINSLKIEDLMDMKKYFDKSVCVILKDII